MGQKTYDEEANYNQGTMGQQGIISNNAQQPSSQFCGTKWKKIALATAAVSLFLLLVILLATSLHKLKSTEYGVQYPRFSKNLDDSAKSGGLYIGPPGYEFIKFPSTYITVDLPDDTCISKDGLRVQVSVTFQFRMIEKFLLPAILKYRNNEKWSTVVQAAGTSAVQHSCSEFFVSNFQNSRGAIQKVMEDNLRLKLEGNKEDGSDGVFAQAVSLQLRNVDLPKEYTDAVAEKQAAEEDIELAQNQRIQDITKANTTLLAAQEEARIINNTAVNDADIILTQAQKKATEIVYAFEKEVHSIIYAKENLNLTTNGVLAWVSNQLFEVVPNLRVSAAEPARLSRRDEL